MACLLPHWNTTLLSRVKLYSLDIFGHKIFRAIKVETQRHDKSTGYVVTRQPLET